MCGRFYIADEHMEAQIARLLAQLKTPDLPNVKRSGEVFPGDVSPVIATNKQRVIRPFFMEWGYHAPGGKRIINARSETAAARPMFRESMALRRCLLPASFYFEWSKEDKTKYMIHPQSGLGLCMAGLYQIFENAPPRYVILTKDASPDLQTIHHLMPVMLPKDMCFAWLDPYADPEKLLRQAVSSVHFRPAQ